MRSGRALRGDVPLPEDRPYSLGNTPDDQASINATSEISASARSRSSGRVLNNPREVSYENDPQYEPNVHSVSAVSAYAPVDPHGPSEILAGRGLY
jgi:rare lipoprotein A